ncbi:MAG: YesL family protein [Hespellia sp.]|nr:YesL family protein [Hespellia sp.]
MKNIFNMDGPIFVFLSKVADILILNIMLLVTCVPIITIGAGLTALYATAMKCICRGEGYVFKTFCKEFALHFKHATLSYLLIGAAYIILYIDFRAVSVMFAATIAWVLRIVICLAALLLLMMASYLFAYIAIADTTMKENFKNSMLISIARLPYTVIMIVLNLAPVIIILVSGYIYIPMLGFYFWAGFAVVASVNSLLLNKTFKRFHMIDSAEDE